MGIDQLDTTANEEMKTVCFWSKRGGTGKTMMATAFALDAAFRGEDSVIIDADFTAPSVRQILSENSPKINTQGHHGMLHAAARYEVLFNQMIKMGINSESALSACNVTNDVLEEMSLLIPHHQTVHCPTWKGHIGHIHVLAPSVPIDPQYTDILSGGYIDRILHSRPHLGYSKFPDQVVEAARSSNPLQTPRWLIIDSSAGFGALHSPLVQNHTNVLTCLGSGFGNETIESFFHAKARIQEVQKKAGRKIDMVGAFTRVPYESVKDITDGEGDRMGFMAHALLESALDMKLNFVPTSEGIENGGSRALVHQLGGYYFSIDGHVRSAYESIFSLIRETAKES